MMGLFGMGFSEVLILLSMNGWGGIPLGVPPEKEDVLMARVAPEECLFYTTWSGVAAPDPKSENYTEQLIAEKEIRQALADIEKKVKEALKKAAGDDPSALLAAEIAPKWGKLLLTHPVAMFLTSVEPAERGVNIKGGMIIRVDEQAEEIATILKRLQADAFENVKTIKIENGTYYQIHPDPSAPPVTWGIRGRYLLAGAGENGIQDMLANIRRNTKSGELPKWLTDVRQQMPVDRVSTVTYANVKKIIEVAGPFAGGPIGMVVPALGFDNVTYYGSVTGLDKTGFVNRSVLGIDGEPKGLLTLAAGKPLTAKDLKSIPYDTPFALAMRLDAAKAFDMYIEMLGRMAPFAVDRIKEGIAESERTLGFSIRKELLASLGDVAYVYAAPDDGGLVTGWTGVVKLRDPMTFARVYETLIKLGREASGDRPRAPKIKQFTFAGYDVYYLSVPDDDMPFLLTWCMANREVVFGLYPQAVKSFLAKRGTAKTLADRPEVAQVLQGDEGPSVITYNDSREVFKIVYPFVQVFGQFMINAIREQGIDIDISPLPSIASISKHLQPSVSTVRRTKIGIETASRHTIPSGSVGSSIPVVAALMLPAVSSARTAARRTQGANNLKQIALAFHNYHDVYRGMPAAFSTDKEGKPLLSWRVHILPFIEQDALYRRFRLDEPWDSEHNKELIPLMPKIYLSPMSKKKGGKTNYLGIRSATSAVSPPRDTKKDNTNPLGSRFADIIDGTSNTILVVEAGDQKAVVWTKPDDFKPNDEKPIMGLLGLFPNGFQAALCDGSVRFISDQVDAEVLKRLFQRNDGKPVRVPR